MKTFYLIHARGKGQMVAMNRAEGGQGGRKERENVQHLHFPRALFMQRCALSIFHGTVCSLWPYKERYSYLEEPPQCTLWSPGLRMNCRQGFHSWPVLAQSGFDACPPDGLPGKMEDKKTFIHQGR